MIIDEIVEDIVATAARPLRQARTLPPAAYVRQDFFEHEAEHVLRANWICVAHVSQLREPGTVLPVDLLGEPIMLVRGQDDVLRVFSRVCPHRAADLLPVTAEGCAARHNLLTCPYHRWSFGLDGRMTAAPFMQAAEGFEKSEVELAPIRSEVWEGFVFVNLDGAAPALGPQYERFREVVAPWRMAALELVISMEWECGFNWKVMVENWIESYHHLGPHTQTLNPFMPAQDTWTEPPDPGFIYAHLPLTGKAAAPLLETIRDGAAGDGFVPLPSVPADKQAEWSLFVGFPCFMLLLARDRAIWYRLQPISVDRCKLTTTTLVSRETLAAPGYQETLARETKMLRDFHLEDMEVNESVQRGLRSRHAKRGRLSHLEAPVWQLHRQLAACLAAAK